MRCSRTKAPSLCRRYPASSVLRASPPPCRPDLTLAGCRLARATPPDRASRVASIPLFHACCRHYPGGTSRCLRRSLPDRWQPSPFSRRVGFRIARFGACSTFAHAAARMVAKPPVAARCVGVLQTMSLPPSSAPTATGWSDSCRAGFAPAEKWRLFTAHAKNHSKGNQRLLGHLYSPLIRRWPHPRGAVCASNSGETGRPARLRLATASPSRAVFQ